LVTVGLEKFEGFLGDSQRVVYCIEFIAIDITVLSNRVYPKCLLRVQSYSKPIAKKVRLENIDKMTTGNKKERKRHNHVFSS